MNACGRVYVIMETREPSSVSMVSMLMNISAADDTTIRDLRRIYARQSIPPESSMNVRLWLSICIYRQKSLWIHLDGRHADVYVCSRWYYHARFWDEEMSVKGFRWELSMN